MITLALDAVVRTVSHLCIVNGPPTAPLITAQLQHAKVQYGSWLMTRLYFSLNGPFYYNTESSGKPKSRLWQMIEWERNQDSQKFRNCKNLRKWLCFAAFVPVDLLHCQFLFNCSWAAIVIYDES
jgi:hypothetical protein